MIFSLIKITLCGEKGKVDVIAARAEKGWCLSETNNEEKQRYRKWRLGPNSSGKMMCCVVSMCQAFLERLMPDDVSEA